MLLLAGRWGGHRWKLEGPGLAPHFQNCSHFTKDGHCLQVSMRKSFNEVILLFRVLNPSAFLFFCIVYIITYCSVELTEKKNWNIHMGWNTFNNKMWSFDKYGEVRKNLFWNQNNNSLIIQPGPIHMIKLSNCCYVPHIYSYISI